MTSWRVQTLHGTAMGHDGTLTLRLPLERALRAGHPWVYRRALQSPPTASGCVVTIVGRNGQFVGRGITDDGPIAIRVFTTKDEPVDAGLLSERLAAACELRRRVVPADTDAYRLVHGEGDQLPGFVVDLYAQYAVLSFDSPALHSWLPTWLEVLTPTLRRLGVRGALARVPKQRELGVRAVWGEPPPERVTVTERGMKLVASLWRGQKTGLFLDHRDSRWRIRQRAQDRRVLNLYGYTGGFSVAAGLGGATEVVTVDTARPALELAIESWSANALDARRHRTVAADVPRFMQDLGFQERFDIVIADPPSFAPNKKSVPKALRAYGNLHRSCLRHVPDGGLYLAASCSSHITHQAFTQSLREAARAAHRQASIIASWGAPPDHPTLDGFPEGHYLKVCLLRIG